MKISRLSRLSGVSVPTIKFYLREQLRPPGTPTARNQAEYDESHLTRRRLIRVLTGVGMMSLASVRNVLGAVDRDGAQSSTLAQVVNRALLADHAMPPADRDGYEKVACKIDGFLDRLGWQVAPRDPERESLVRALVALDGLGVPCVAEELEPYALIAEQLASHELGRAASAGDPQLIVARMVLFDVAFEILRRMAFNHHVAAKLGDGASGRS